MKALYEVIVASTDDRGGTSVQTEILEFLLSEHYDQFKNNIEEYEKINGIQVWRSITRIS